MEIPLRPYNLKYSMEWPKHIIIHHTNELNLKASSSLEVDKQSSQTSLLKALYYEQNMKTDLPYHYVIEYVLDDYTVSSVRPLFTKCIFDDLDETYYDDIHIAILGNYDEYLPKRRVYNVMCYELIVPFVRLFKIQEKDILLHREISNNPDQTCPGEFFKIEKLKQTLSGMMRRTTLTRR